MPPPLAALVPARGLAGAGLSCFVGIRAVQAVELQLARSGLSPADASRVLDGAFAAPLGLMVVLPFLVGTFLGLVAIGVACWRAGLPRPAALLLVAFPVVDQVAGGGLGATLAHVVLLVAVGWIAVHVWRRP